MKGASVRLCSSRCRTYDRPARAKADWRTPASINVRQIRSFRIENRIRAAYDDRDPQSSRMVSATLPGVAFRLERQGHRSSLVRFRREAEPRAALGRVIDFGHQAA